MSKKHRNLTVVKPVALEEDGKYIFTEDEQADYEELSEKRQQATDALAITSVRYAEAKAQMENAVQSLLQAHQTVEAWFAKVCRKRGLDKHPIKTFNGDEGFVIFDVQEEPADAG